MKDGTTLSRRVDYPKGEPENPLTDEELEAKFVSLAKASGISGPNCKKNNSNYKSANIQY